MTATPLLQVEQLACWREQKQIFKPVSFTLASGELLLIEGANGAGKSSLLRMIAGIATPSHGILRWQGESLDENYLDQIHYLGHQHGIRLGLTVAENCALTAKLLNLPLTMLTETLTRLSLQHLADTQTQFLSAGQIRRTALAKLFLFKKALWVLDEPFAALDKDMQAILGDKLTEHVNSGGMAIVTSHQPLPLATPMKNVRLTC